MKILGFHVTRENPKDTEDLALGMFHADGTVNLHGVAMGVMNLRHHLGKMDGKLVVITALIIFDMGSKFPWVKDLLSPAAALAQGLLIPAFWSIESTIVGIVR